MTPAVWGGAGAKRHRVYFFLVISLNFTSVSFTVEWLKKTVFLIGKNGQMKTSHIIFIEFLDPLLVIL